METASIAELLAPFTTPAVLSPGRLLQMQSYLDLLLRWNVRMNLTAVCDPEQVVTRHFGESLFAARVLLRESAACAEHRTLADVGSGAGFPGIPMKLLEPEIDLTLIESQNKKATFLREVIRTLGLKEANVFCGRAEQWGNTADLVTLRAVERFERTLPVAAKLVAGQGRLCLLIGAGQVPIARQVLGAAWGWQVPEAIPHTDGRVVLVGRRSESDILLQSREDE